MKHLFLHLKTNTVDLPGWNELINKITTKQKLLRRCTSFIVITEVENASLQLNFILK